MEELEKFVKDKIQEVKKETKHLTETVSSRDSLYEIESKFGERKAYLEVLEKILKLEQNTTP